MWSSSDEEKEGWEEEADLASLLEAAQRPDAWTAIRATRRLCALSCDGDGRWSADEWCNRTAAAGGIAIFAAAARRSEPRVAYLAVQVLCNLSAGETRRDAVLEGALPELVTAVQRPEADVARTACDALSNACAAGADGAGARCDSVLSAGAATALAAAVQRRKAEVARSACTSLFVLTARSTAQRNDEGFRTRCDNVISSGALPALVAAVQRREAEASRFACLVLVNLTAACSSQRSNGDVIARRDSVLAAGAAPVLAAAALRTEAPVATAALDALGYLSIGHDNEERTEPQCAAVWEVTGSEALVAAVRRQQSSVAASALELLCCLTSSIERRDDFWAAGGVSIVTAAALRPERDVAAAAAQTLVSWCGSDDQPVTVADALAAGGGAAALLAGAGGPDKRVAARCLRTLGLFCDDMSGGRTADTNFIARREAIVATRGGVRVLAAAVQNPEEGGWDEHPSVWAAHILRECALGDDARCGARRDAIAAGAAHALVAAALRDDDSSDDAAAAVWALAAGDDAGADARRGLLLLGAGAAELAALHLDQEYDEWIGTRAAAVRGLAQLTRGAGAGARLAAVLSHGCIVLDLVACLTPGDALAAPAAQVLAQLAAAGGGEGLLDAIAAADGLARLVALMAAAPGAPAFFHAAAALAELARAAPDLIASLPGCLPLAAAALSLTAARVDLAADRLLCAVGAERVFSAAGADAELRTALLRAPGAGVARLAVRCRAVWGDAPSPQRRAELWRLASLEDRAGALRLALVLRRLSAAVCACVAARPWLLFEPLPPGEPVVARLPLDDFLRM